ncbi:MAG TPA: AAA family ATPase [Mesorhizobium sp.]|jgi:predicted kinase|nr:AAA family ATPase [Mesorhizobium sp.]
MKRLIVISGPANTGKMPLARKLMADAPELALVHRDDIRRDLCATVDEGVVTHLMGEMARLLLGVGYPVIVCAWNLQKSDHDLWFEIARDTDAPIVWLDVRAREVAAMIPPL